MHTCRCMYPGFSFLQSQQDPAMQAFSDPTHCPQALSQTKIVIFNVQLLINSHRRTRFQLTSLGVIGVISMLILHCPNNILCSKTKSCGPGFHFTFHSHISNLDFKNQKPLLRLFYDCNIVLVCGMSLSWGLSGKAHDYTLLHSSGRNTMVVTVSSEHQGRQCHFFYY